MTAVETKLSEMFDELVPASGAAETVAGEIVRAISRIGYRYYNDGDRIGVEYGKETCNPAARFLEARCGREVRKALDNIWGCSIDGEYEDGLAVLEYEVLKFLEAHPELRTEKNAEDMWDYRNQSEDVDDEWDDDEEEEDYEDDYDEEEW